MRKINVGLLGCGTVGTGVAKILLENSDIIRLRLGAELCLYRLADIDASRADTLGLAPGVYTDDGRAMVSDPAVDIVVEMIGGQGIAKELMLAAIANGKHVVTANKALLAGQGGEILAAANEKGVELAYEASVGGCMPIVKTLRESLVGNHVQAMTGILNGTCNYILTQITREGSTFEKALAEAQAAGYAEADPTLDVEGLDTAHKLAILSSLAYGMELNLYDIYIEGISRISPLDIQFAEQFGYRIKLLAISKYKGDRVEARVHPTMIPLDNLLSSINGRVNAVVVSADAVDDIMLYGYGAGMMPTASAVVGDIVDIARNIIHGSVGRIPVLAFQTDAIRRIPVVPIDELTTHYYIRFSALDQPGVLSNISGILGKHGISIQSVQQIGRKTNGTVPLVMLTHLAQEANVKKALGEIEVLDIVSDQPVFIRIEDENGQD
jgi:homoserine dehydrogenase